MSSALSEVLALAADLSACLDSENAALASGKSDAISETCSRKDALVDSLQRATQSIDWDDLEPRTQRDLVALMRRCKQQNLANAALLEARVSQVRWALNHLGIGGPAVYGRDGKTQNAFARRTVGSA